MSLRSTTLHDEMHVLINVGVQAARNRTGVRNAAKSFLLALGRIGRKREGKVYLNPGNAPRVVGHVLVGRCLSGEYGKILQVCVNPHRGDDARRQTERAQVGGRKGGTLTLVVGRGIGEDAGSGLLVKVLAAEAAEVGGGKGSHGAKLQSEHVP